jgi:8-oxo-dGTP pyrophosphatase MutT (NUDIX family)
LVEDRQVFDEGTNEERVRQRGEMGGAVREKLHPREDATVAAHRALREELGIDTKVDITLIKKENLDKESPSYPGLRTQYGATYFATELIGDQIKPEGYREVELDKTTYFIWTKQLAG